jgi:hypothetical protein
MTTPFEKAIARHGQLLHALGMPNLEPEERAAVSTLLLELDRYIVKAAPRQIGQTPPYYCYSHLQQKQ